ncbi:MAG: hypothetical protein L0Y75_06385 [Acidobacteria bacterium]|nr:hypothetical protein [Acidobacteriota bacterium]
MKQRLPAIITVLLIISAIAFFAKRDRTTSTSKAPVTPEDVVWRMSDAARAGDVNAYLECFGGALKSNLQRTVAEMGEAQFSQYLKRLNGEMTGIAVSDFEQVSQNEAALRVEFVFRSKNEAQKHHFRLINGAWKIEKLDGAEQIKSLTPYGSDVIEKEESKD